MSARRVAFLCALAGCAVAAEIARPGATAADWLANPEAAARAAGKTAEALNGLGPGAWTVITIAALAALRMVAPFIPGGGPVVKLAADVVWSLMAHKDQKAADQPQAALWAALQVATRLAEEQEIVAKQAAAALGDEAGDDALQKVAANKRAAALLQVDAGVHLVTQRARGKA